MGLPEQLQELEQLLSAGKLTPEEFDFARTRLLGTGPLTAAPTTHAVHTGSRHTAGRVRVRPLGGVLALIGAALAFVEFHDGPWDFASYLEAPQSVMAITGTAIPRLALAALGGLYLMGIDRKEFRGALAAVGLCVALDSLVWDISSRRAMIVGVIGGLLGFVGSIAWGRR